MSNTRPASAATAAGQWRCIRCTGVAATPACRERAVEAAVGIGDLEHHAAVERDDARRGGEPFGHAGRIERHALERDAAPRRHRQRAAVERDDHLLRERGAAVEAESGKAGRRHSPRSNPNVSAAASPTAKLPRANVPAAMVASGASASTRMHSTR